MNGEGVITSKIIPLQWQIKIVDLITAISGILTFLWAWSYFQSGIFPMPSGIGFVAIFAASIFIKLKLADHLIEYGAAALTLATGLNLAFLIYQTGGVASPYGAFWILPAIISGIYSLWLVLPFLILPGVYILMTIFSEAGFNPLTAKALFLFVLPVAASFWFWRIQEFHDNKKDSAVHRLKNQLSQASGKAEVVINTIADGVLAIDKNGNIELINPAAQQIIGWGKQDAVGLKYNSVLKILNIKDEPVDDLQNPIENTLNNNQEIKTDKLKLVTDSGKKILASIIVSPISSEKSGVIVVFRDITRDKIEEREQAEFISTASHEMRTPVASIEGYLGLALNPATAQIDEKAREYITKAHESAEHLGRLFQDLLDISKAEDGRLTNNPKVINVNNFVQDIANGLTPKANEKGLEVIFKPNNQSQGVNGDRTISPVYYTFADADHLREITANLIENAIKYTPQGQVIIDLNQSQNGNAVQIMVHDTGIGIPREDLPHLFQKFYRVDNSDTREIGGTGLGLYLCRRLAEAIGGRIWVESEYKKGSTFTLEMPRATNEQIADYKAEPEVQPVVNNLAQASNNPPQEINQPTSQINQQQTHSQNSFNIQSQPQTQLPQNTAPAAPAPSMFNNPNAPKTVNPTPQQQLTYNQSQYSTPTQPQQDRRYASPTYQQRENIPLSQIEQNPEEYRRRISGS